MRWNNRYFPKKNWASEAKKLLYELFNSMRITQGSLEHFKTNSKYSEEKQDKANQFKYILKNYKGGARSNVKFRLFVTMIIIWNMRNFREVQNLQPSSSGCCYSVFRRINAIPGVLCLSTRTGLQRYLSHQNVCWEEG